MFSECDKTALTEAKRLADLLHDARVIEGDFMVEDHMVDLPGTGFHVSVGCDCEMDNRGFELYKPTFVVMEETEDGCFVANFFDYRQEVVDFLPGEWI